MTRFKLAIPVLVFLTLTTLCSYATHAQTPPSMTFTQTATTDGKTVTRALTWSTTPAAASCTASGDWTGTKAAAGTEAQAPVAASKVYTLNCNWPGDTVATITWTPPTSNADGSALAKCASQTATGPCLRSFLVLRGSDATSVGMDSKPVDDRNATSYVWTGLPAATHWFSVAAVNGDGIIGAQFVPPQPKTITAASNISQTLTLGFAVPGTPTNVTVK